MKNKIAMILLLEISRCIEIFRMYRRNAFFPPKRGLKIDLLGPFYFSYLPG